MFHFRYRKRDNNKHVSINGESSNNHLIEFSYSPALAFARRNLDNNYSDFMKYARIEMLEGGFFDAFAQCQVLYESGNKVSFRSDLESGLDCNNNFVCTVDKSQRGTHAVILVNHAFSVDRYSSLSKYLVKKDMTVVQYPLPFHFERKGHGIFNEQRVLSPDIGLTLHTIRQAVLDIRKVIRWLKTQGFRTFSVVGYALGGVVAGLVAAHETLVSKAVLMFTPSSVADAVWSGDVLADLRASIEPHLTLHELRSAWSLINLENYGVELSRTGLSLLFVFGGKDLSSFPDPCENLLRVVRRERRWPDFKRLRCDHTALGSFPYNIQMARSVGRFLEYRSRRPWYAIGPEGL